MPPLKLQEVTEALFKVGCPRILIRSGQALFYEKLQPLGYYFMVNGKVKVMNELPQKREVMMSIIVGGQFLGVQEFFSGVPYQFTARAIDATETFFISANHHSALIEDSYFADLLNKKGLWRK